MNLRGKKLKNNIIISIIGGGISGCVSAFLLSNLGYAVNLYEKKDQLGGSIKDIKENKDIFLNGPQYFHNNSDWVEKLKKIKLFKKDFYNFKESYFDKNNTFNVYKSYTDIFNTVQINEIFAQPQTQIVFKKIKKNKSVLLKDRLDSYQDNIKKPLENWCKNFNNQYEKLHESCAEVMNVTRVFFSKNENKIKLLKKKNKIADKLLGIPMTNEKEIFCIPRNGYDFFFKKFEKILKNKVNIYYNSNVKIIKENSSNLTMFNNQKKINTDKIIWTANPIHLLKNLGYDAFDNSVVRTKVYCANINFINKKKIDNFYIQVFSKKTNIYRIYVYKIKNNFKITLETFMNRKNTKVDIDFLHKILSKFKIKIKILNSFIEKKEIRHILITNNDYDIFMKFYNDFKNKKLIGGGWHLFGREKKINFIMKHFES